MADSVSFFVEMTPAPKERQRHTKYGHTYTPEKTRRAESVISVEARLAMNRAGMELLTGPLALTLTIKLKRPKTVKRYSPCVKPDFDNYAKLVCDAMNGIVYVDDGQVVDAHITKVYAGNGEPVGVFVNVYKLGE